LTIPHLSFVKANRKTFLLNFDQIQEVFPRSCFAVRVSLELFFNVKQDFEMYNFSMSGTNPTTKTEAHNSVPFITKVRADVNLEMGKKNNH